ncbi:aminotransferase class V-fold PLP-dependent enzyme [Alloiococcus sp. CFN-8]|uniref:aminotransferase class V-fold PLP-dependent enzyme n=1 Tax=Alloiococcus sp. CFN-8 TaxID=3416081 RepID=UPI003CF79DC4
MIYLDNAATSFPKPSEVYEEVLSAMKTYGANPGRSSHSMGIEASSVIMDTRSELAELLNVPNPLNIIFTSNATEALNIAIKGVLQKGDHIISTLLEHNSVLRPLDSLGKRGMSYSLIGTDGEGHVDLSSLKREIRKNTRAIIINHASNVLGTLQNLKAVGEIALRHGLTFIVDGSQSVGAIDINVRELNIDLLAFPGHKGLLGPQGTGGLYIREGLHLETFKEGGTGSSSHSVTQPNFLPDRFESGTLNTPGIAGLGQGIKFIKKEGLNNIKAKEDSLINQLIEELSALSYVKLYGPKDTKNRTSVFSLNLEGFESSQVGQRLNALNIAVRTGYHCAPFVHTIIDTMNRGTVRISPGYFNTPEDIEALVKGIIGIYSGGI